MQRGLYKSKQKLCAYFAHTHNLKLIERFLSDPVERDMFFDPKKNINFEKRLTVSPSQIDIYALINLKKTLIQRAQHLGVVIEQTVGIVVGPYGYYRYQSLDEVKNNSHHVAPEPNLKSPIDVMNFKIESQRLVDLRKKLVSRKVTWTTSVNESEDTLNDLILSVEFQKLKQMYALPGFSMFLSF